MERIYLPNMGPNTDSIPIALALGIRECNRHHSAILTLVTPLKDNLDSIIIGEFLGEAVSKRLIKGEEVPLTGDVEGISLKHESMATVQRHQTPDVVLAFYLSSKHISALDGLNLKSLIYVPWLDDDGKKWASKWNAETHGKETTDSGINLQPEVIASLTRLTTCVNLSTGLGHPSDKDRAKRTFSNLRSESITWIPSEIEKWAVRNGWKTDDAQELAKLSSRFT